MKSIIKLAISTIVFTSLSVVHAQSNWYAGVGVQKTKIKFKNEKVAVASTTAQSNFADYKKVNLTLLVGKRMDNVAVEVQYTKHSKDSIGDVNVDVNGTGTKVGIKISGNSLAMSGLYYINTGNSFSPFVSVGINRSNITSYFDVAGASTSIKIKNTKLKYGVGVDGKISNSMRYRLEVTKIKDFSTNFGAGLIFDF